MSYQQTINAAKGMSPNSFQASYSMHKKQNSIKTPTKMNGVLQSSTLANAYDTAANTHERREDGMKVCKGPFNVNCTTSKDPQMVLFEMVKSLEM